MRNKPFLLKPACKDYLWGGTRLRDDFSKEGARTFIKKCAAANSWEFLEKRRLMDGNLT